MIEKIKKEIFTEKYIIHDTYINLDVIGVNDLKKVLDKYNMIYPDYKDLLYQNDSLHSERQEYKDKEDKIRELITAPIDGMSLDRLGRDILQILNDTVVE